VNGRIRLRRRWWHSAVDGSAAPVDVWLMPEGENVTVGVREMACRLNNDAASFEKATENLKRTAQIKMSAEQLRQVVQGEGRRVLAAQQSEAIAPAFTAADCLVPGERSKTRLYTGIDGVMVPVITDAEKKKRREKVVQKRRQAEQLGTKRRPLPPRRIGADQSFKEFKTVTFYDEANAHRHIVLSRLKRTQVGSILRREAERLKFREADERIANVDGASWIPPQLEDAELRLHGIGLDFYHLSENVHKARRRIYGEENPQGQAWAGQLLHIFKHEGYERAYDELTTWQAVLRGRKRAAATKLLNYVVERRNMINYPQFAAKGWQIGSGPTEARCKTSTARLKRSGQRWDRRSAEQVAALANLRDSGQWDAYWSSRLARRT
jgi:hypothetical protein